MKIMLDMRTVGTPGELQEYLKRSLFFPDYYGKNLDALHDMLTSWTQPAEFCLRLPASEEMRDYSSRLLRVFQDSARENPRIRVRA